MPSTRVANAVGGGGILRRKDGTVLDLQFTTKNPLFKGEERAAKIDPKTGKAVSKPLYAVFTIMEDGKTPTLQPMRVAYEGDFEVVCDGRGLKGTKQFNKNSQFMVFYASLVSPIDGGAGFNENLLPEDPDQLVADYSNLRGARVQFDWVKDTSKWALENPRVQKDKEGKEVVKDGKKVTHPRENLVVAVYYGQQDLAKVSVPAVAGAATAKPAAAAAPVAIDAAVITATAEDNVVSVLSEAKDKTLTIKRLNVKLLSALADVSDELREAVRLYCMGGDNLAAIPGVSFDKATQMVKLG
jgi:hypothetical protein